MKYSIVHLCKALNNFGMSIKQMGKAFENIGVAGCRGSKAGNELKYKYVYPIKSKMASLRMKFDVLYLYAYYPTSFINHLKWWR